jgi:DNA-directed RNA polymerase subunit RPC12/RpoP
MDKKYVCIRCGFEVEEGEVQCPNCGKKELHLKEVKKPKKIIN